MPDKIKRAVFYLLLMLAPFATVYAITLDEAITLALENNADLKTQAVSLESARRTNASSWNKFLPSVSLTGSLTNSHSFGAGGTDSWNWNAAAGLSIGFTAGIPAQLKQSTLEYEAALTSYAKLEKEITSKVSSSFYSLLAEYENIAILKDSLELSKQQYEQIKKNYESGLASELETLKAQYTYLAAGPTLETAVTTYKANLAEFQTLIGSESAVTPEGELTLRRLVLPEAEELTAAYAENRFDVIQKRQALEQAQTAKTVQTLNTNAPSISLSENLRLTPDTQYAFSGTPSAAGSFSVSVSIPLDGFIPGSSKNLTIKSAQDSVTTAQIALDTARVKAAQDIETKAAALNKVWSTIDVTQLNYRIAARSYELSKEGYEAGLISQTDLESSRQQMVSARQNLSQTAASYITASYDLADALNISIEELYRLFGAETTRA